MGQFITRRLARRVTFFGEENSKLPANDAVRTTVAIQACAGPIRLQPKTETAVVLCIIMVLIYQCEISDKKGQKIVQIFLGLFFKTF